MLRGAFLDGGVFLPGREIVREDLAAYSDEYVKELVKMGKLEEVKDGRQIQTK